MQFLTDTLIIFKRSLRLMTRDPKWVIIGLTQPILYLALFGPLLTTLANQPGFPAGNAWQVFVPGLLIQLGLFGSAFVGFQIVAELRYGVVERMRVTPMSRLSLLLGRVLRDVLVLLVQGAILVVVAIPFGLRAPWLGVLAGFGIIAILASTLASLSFAAGLTLKDEGPLAALINSLAVPLLLLSGILLPMTLAPGWLHFLSRIDPFSYTVDAMRDLFLGDYAATGVLLGVLVTAIVAVLGLAVGTRTFRAENA